MQLRVAIFLLTGHGNSPKPVSMTTSDFLSIKTHPTGWQNPPLYRVRVRYEVAVSGQHDLSLLI
jgi:hypothetical protein